MPITLEEFDNLVSERPEVEWNMRMRGVCSRCMWWIGPKGVGSNTVWDICIVKDIRTRGDERCRGQFRSAY